MIKTLTKLVIDRKTWLRGKGSAVSCLLREDGKQCCLGQFAIKAGVKKKNLINIKSPWELNMRKKINIKQINDRRVSKSIEAMAVNDNELISNKTREEKLIEIFSQFNPPVELSFEN